MTKLSKITKALAVAAVLSLVFSGCGNAGNANNDTNNSNESLQQSNVQQNNAVQNVVEQNNKNESEVQENKPKETSEIADNSDKVEEEKIYQPLPEIINAEFEDNEIQVDDIILKLSELKTIDDVVEAVSKSENSSKYNFKLHTSHEPYEWKAVSNIDDIFMNENLLTLGLFNNDEYCVDFTLENYNTTSAKSAEIINMCCGIRIATEKYHKSVYIPGGFNIWQEDLNVNTFISLLDGQGYEAGGSNAGQYGANHRNEVTAYGKIDERIYYPAFGGYTHDKGWILRFTFDEFGTLSPGTLSYKAYVPYEQ